MTEILIPNKPVRNIDSIPCPTEDPALMRLEHLEARICELAGHDHDGPARERQTPEQRLRERDAADGIDWDADHKPWRRERIPGEDLADAIVGICGGYLSGRVADAGTTLTSSSQAFVFW